MSMTSGALQPSVPRTASTMHGLGAWKRPTCMGVGLRRCRGGGMDAAAATAAAMLVMAVCAPARTGTETHNDWKYEIVQNLV